MTLSPNIDFLVNKALYISVARKCALNLRPSNKRRSQKNYSARIPPTCKQELKTIETLFKYFNPFNNLQWSISDEWQWKSYNMLKVAVKPTESLLSTDRQCMVADGFSVLSISRSENIPDTEETNEISAPVQQAGICDHTQAPTISIDVDDIDASDLPNSVDDEDTDNNTSEHGVEEEDMDDTEHQSDLKSLSNLKNTRSV